MIILGIGGILDESAAAVLRDGALVGAVEQRRVARRLRPGALPEEAIASCLRLAGVEPGEVDCVAVTRPLGTGPDNPLHLSLRAAFPNSQVVVAPSTLIPPKALQANSVARPLTSCFRSSISKSTAFASKML